MNNNGHAAQLTHQSGAGAPHLSSAFSHDVYALVSQLMAEKDISVPELAARMRLSPSMTIRLLKGNDMTLADLSSMFSALGEEAFIGRKYTSPEMS